VHDCYDKRHPQEAVRDKGWECGGDGAQGTGLDWNGAGRLTRPDVDPLSFIQEPNDAYFTTIPTSTFGIGSLSYCVPDYNGFDCDTLTYDYPLNSWNMANDSRDQLGHSTSNLVEDSAGARGEVCDGEVRYIYDTCYGSSGTNTPDGTGRMDGAGTTKPTWVCDAVYSKDGDAWPSIKLTGDQYFNGNQVATLAEVTAQQDNSEKPFEIVWIFALQNIDVTTETTIFKTSPPTTSDSRNQNDEGIRIYPQPDGSAYVGFRIPLESRWHPLNNPATTSASGICTSCQGTCWANELNPSDIDIWWFKIEANETFMMTIQWREDKVIVQKNSGVETYEGSPYLALEDSENNCTAKYVRGGYIPWGLYIHRYASPKTTFEFLEMFSLMEQGHTRITSTQRNTVEEYLSWKYNIEIPNRNFPSCS
jgi:hypothetical protein